MSRKAPNPLTVKELETIKTLRASGLTYHAISKEVSRDPKTIKKACLEPETAQEIQVIKEELSNMYEDVARRMIVSITDADILKLDAYKRTLSSGIATDKMRLLRDQSTTNLAIELSLHERISRELELLEAEPKELE